MSPGFLRQGFFRLPSLISHFTRALAFISRSTSAYTLVVLRHTWPSQARIVLMSTPARRRWVAVVWRIVWGVTRFFATDGSFRCHLSRIAFDHRIYSESGQRLPATVEEDMLGCVSTINERTQFVNHPRPEWTTAAFVSFATQNNGRRIAAGCNTEVEVADLHMGHLVGPSTGVVQKQKNRVVPTTLGSATVGRLQQRIQFVLFQVPDQWAGDFLRRDGLNLPAPFQVFRAVLTDETRQGVDRRETLISRGGPTAASFLQILKERSGAGWRNILHAEPLDPSVGSASDERQKLLQRIPVACLRIAGEIPFGNEVLQQEPADPGAKQIGVRHGDTPFRHSARSAGWPHEEARASCSGTPACPASGRDRDRLTGDAGVAARRHLADTRR